MKTIGLARLGRDAETRSTPNGEQVANLSLAVPVYDKDAENNRGTQWVEATLWGRQAEALAPYLLKGTVHCFYLSDVKIDFYTNRDGEKVPKMVARVDHVELGPRQSDAGTSQRTNAPAPAARRAPAPAARAGGGGSSGTGFDDMSDDIPYTSSHIGDEPTRDSARRMRRYG